MLKLDNITKVYGKESAEECVLQGVSLEIAQHDLIAITGKSGSGKSTLLNIIGLLAASTSGTYELNGSNIKALTERQRAQLRNETFGYIVQNYALIPEYTAYENVVLPLKYNKKVPKAQRKEYVRDIFNKLEISHLFSKYCNELSGGQKQRVAIARALVNDPQIILADEPTGSLDSENRQKILDILLQLHKEGKTLIIVTHDEEIANMCHRKITVADGKTKQTEITA